MKLKNFEVKNPIEEQKKKKIKKDIKATKREKTNYLQKKNTFD